MSSIASSTRDTARASPLLPVLLRAAWRHRRSAALALALLVASRLAFVAVPWQLKRIVEAFGVTPPPSLLPVFLLLSYALLRFAGGLFNELRDLAFAPVTQGMVASMTLDVFRHLHRLGARFHAQRETGSLIRDVESGTNGLAYLLGVALFTIAPTLVEIGAVLVIMLGAYRAGFGLIIVASFIVYALVTVWLAARRTRLQRKLNAQDARAHGRLVDSLLNHETVKASAAEDWEAARLDESLRARTALSLRAQRALSVLHVAQSGVIACGVAAVMLYAGQEVIARRLGVGDLVLINAYIIQVCLPLNALGFVFREARDAQTNVERLFALRDETPEFTPEAPGLVFRPGAGEVRFEHVDFGYEPGRQLLWDIDFRIAPGATVAVVGGSGSGKSTLARLLLRYYRPDAGRVLVDGQDIATLDPASLRRAIGLVPQDTTLFNDTIRYNIAYGLPQATMGEIVDAARIAHADEFIVHLPQQYDTPVGERGVKLSGGERQRVAIARAVLRKPLVLVFDEATSALDTRAEREIQTDIEQLIRERTTLVIAHRLSTVVDADEILVLERGRIVERGRHEALLAAQGLYAQLWSLQRQQSELERTEHQLALQPVNLAALAAAVVDGLGDALQARRLTLYTDLHAQDARVTGDPGQLQRLLWSLLASAIARAARGGRVELGVARQGPSARITVLDTGGVAPDARSGPLPHDELAALDPLALRSIVESHHGHFEATALPGGQGSRVVVELPLRATRDAPSRADDAPATAVRLDGCRICVVDDEADAREALAAILQLHGAEVIGHGDGAEALRALHDGERPSILLCDIALGGGISGYELIRRVRADEAARKLPLHERLPAVALSGYAGPEDRMQSLLSGFQLHLAKPVDPDELVATIAGLTTRTVH